MDRRLLFFLVVPSAGSSVCMHQSASECADKQFLSLSNTRQVLTSLHPPLVWHLVQTLAGSPSLHADTLTLALPTITTHEAITVIFCSVKLPSVSAESLTGSLWISGRALPLLPPRRPNRCLASLPQPSWSQHCDTAKPERDGGRKKQRIRYKRRGAVRPLLLLLTGKKLNKAMGQRAKVGRRSKCRFWETSNA